MFPRIKAKQTMQKKNLEEKKDKNLNESISKKKKKRDGSEFSDLEDSPRYVKLLHALTMS